MSLTTKIVKTAISAVVAVGFAVGLQAPLATSAEAGDWRGRGYGYGHYNSHPGYRHAPRAHAYYPPPRRRNDVGGQIAKGVAIGIGAAVVGAILADQARRTRNEYYD